MLFMVGTKPAVVGTAKFRAGLEIEGPVSRFDVVLAELVIGNIGGNQRLHHAMRLAALQVVDIPVFNDDLGRHQAWHTSQSEVVWPWNR